jgi:hypothetical protein
LVILSVGSHGQSSTAVSVCRTSLSMEAIALQKI